MNHKNETLRNISVPVLSVLLGLILGAIIMLIFGYNPILGYKSLIEGSVGSSFYIGETLRQATPLILTALGFAVANTAGFFNIGVAGQALFGWLGSVTLAIMFPDLPRMLLIPLCLIGGAVTGAIWAGIAGYLRAYFGTSEVIVTIMLNYTALYISNHMVRNVLTNADDATPRISDNATLRSGFLANITDNSTLHYGLFIAIIMCIVMWIFMNKTTAGYELRAVGLNSFAAEYAGMSAKQNIVMAMVISGVLAGLGGSMEGIGNFQNIFVMSSMPSIGFDGMAVSLLGAGNPFGILVSALLFGALKIGGISMPMGSDVPTEVVDIVIAAIIFFVGANYLIRYFMNKFNQPKIKITSAVTAKKEVN